MASISRTPLGEALSLQPFNLAASGWPTAACLRVADFLIFDCLTCVCWLNYYYNLINRHLLGYSPSTSPATAVITCVDCIVFLLWSLLSAWTSIWPPCHQHECIHPKPWLLQTHMLDKWPSTTIIAIISIVMSYICINSTYNRMTAWPESLNA